MNILYVLKEDPRTGLGHAAQRSRAFLTEWKKQREVSVVFCFPKEKTEIIKYMDFKGIGFQNKQKPLKERIIDSFYTYHFRLIKKHSAKEILNHLDGFKPDVVVAEELPCAEIALELGKSLNRPAMLVEHNFEYSLYTQMHPHQFIKRMLLKAREKNLLKKMKTVFAFSDTDQNKINKNYELTNLRSTRAGVNTSEFNDIKFKSSSNKIAIVGSLDYFPNIDGLQWFAQEIKPLVKAKIEVIVIGKNPTPEVVSLCQKNNFELINTPPDIKPHLANVYAEIVPLRMGSGTRGKILEAAACKIPIISTSLGAEGLSFRSNHDIIISDSPASFAQSIDNLFLDKNWAAALAENAHKTVIENYDYSSVVRDLTLSISTCL